MIIMISEIRKEMYKNLNEVKEDKNKQLNKIKKIIQDMKGIQ
jgi:hypothetical protein